MRGRYGRSSEKSRRRGYSCRGGWRLWCGTGCGGRAEPRPLSPLTKARDGKRIPAAEEAEDAELLGIRELGEGNPLRR